METVNIVIEMENGDVMKGELYPEVAPITVKNFLDLIDQGVDFDKAHFLSMQQDLKKQIDLLKGL